MSSASAEIAIVAGPTASGKSAHALRMAQARGGVIVNADSLQVYDALPVLTATPSVAERAQVPHRLYAFLQPDEAVSAARWRSLAIEEIRAALAAGLYPIVCGGTGFYLEALMHGLSPIPDVPEAVRAEVQARQTAMGNPAFHATLAARDPQTAARLHPSDTQRLVRAFAVLEHTGRPIAFWQDQPREGPPAGWRFKVEILMPPRDALYRRCDTRFAGMMGCGALAEVAAFERRIEERRWPADCPPTRALGYEALRAHLRGDLSQDEAVDLACRQTRQYAKRQITWLRHRMGSVSPDGGAIQVTEG